jgi:glycosyltransferase involved in cell wall biosynthesis
MAAGKTVVAAVEQDVYGKGVLRDEENVVLIDLDDLPSTANRFIQLLGDTSKRRAIGSRASLTVRKHFSWDAVCDQTIEVYRGIIRK